MKHILFTLVLMASIGAQAGIDDFNSIIEENMKAEQELRNELKKHIQTVDVKELKKKKNFKETNQAILGKQDAENVAVESSNVGNYGAEEIRRKNTDFEKKNLKRLSEEIREIQ